MTPTQRAAMQQALECLHDNRGYIISNERPEYLDLYDKAIGDAEAALSEPAEHEQEPVGEVAEVAQGYDEGWTAIIETGLHKLQQGDKVYTAPQPVKREPLTDEHKAVLLECRNQAMKWAAQGRIPECGAFGGIAQDLDWLCYQVGITKE